MKKTVDMPHQLKLDIYTFHIKPRFTREDDQHIVFKDFFKSRFTNEGEEQDEIEKNVYFARFIQSFTNLFDGQFAINSDETKGMHVEKLNVSPSRNCFDGIMNGGTTGIKQSVYDRENPDEAEDEISYSQLTTLPHYMKIWTPYDSTLGVIMVQNYSEGTLTSLVLELFRKFFISKDVTFKFQKHVTEEYKRFFKENSIVQEINYNKVGLGRDSRNSLSPIFIEEDKMRIQIKLSNLHIHGTTLDDFLSGKQTVNMDIPELGIDRNEDYDTVAIYKDPKGHRAQMSLKDMNMTPTIYLPDNLKDSSSQNVNYDLIKNHTDAILEIVKREIGYNPS